jgi:choline kinase
MRVIIPAAGQGTRLLPHTAQKPKCLVPVGGIPIIERLLNQLCDTGAKEVICVTGYRADQLEEHVSRIARRPPVTFIHNPRYERSDNIVSLLATEEYFDDEVCVIDSDVLLSQRLVDLLVDGEGDAAVVDTTKRWPDIDMAAETHDGALWHLAKELPPERTSGEFFGVSRWTAEGARRLIDTVRDMVAHGTTGVWYPFAIRSLAKRHRVAVLEAQPDEWIEVDSTRDLALAEAGCVRRAGWTC